MKTSPHIVVLSSNHDPQIQEDSVDQDGKICVVQDLGELQQEAQRHPVDGLVIDNGFSFDPNASLTQIQNLSKTIILTHTVSAVEAASQVRNLLNQETKGAGHSKHHKDVTLEDYVESKFREFVKAMKVSSSRSLHETLIRAVERPLIKIALQETNGNQIKASELLGMNRNTLRKKIREFKITVKRRSRSQRDRNPT